MIVICRKCKFKIIDLNFPDREKSEIIGLLAADNKLTVVKKIMSDYSLSHAEAKGIAMHLNKHGKCHNCTFDHLEGENVECPKCSSFNYNLK